MTERNESAFLTGFIAGAALGAMSALLLAPKSGRELRSELAEESGRLRERASDLRERASEKTRELRARGNDAWRRTRETAERARRGGTAEMGQAEATGEAGAGLNTSGS